MVLEAIIRVYNSALKINEMNLMNFGGTIAERIRSIFEREV